MRKAKKNYIKNQIEENRQSPKKLWQTLKNLGLPRKSKSASRCTGLKENDSDEISFNENFVSNRFNRFFGNIATELAQKLPDGQFDYDGMMEFYQKQRNCN